MYISSVNFNIKFEAQKIKHPKLNKPKRDVSREEYLEKLKKIYTEIENDYKDRDLTKILAEREKFLLAFKNKINQSEQMLPNIEFNI